MQLAGLTTVISQTVERIVGEERTEKVMASEHGYVIKINIEGKMIHGMLFFYTSSFVKHNHAYSNKKRIATNTYDDEVNKYQPALSVAPIWANQWCPWRRISTPRIP